MELLLFDEKSTRNPDYLIFLNSELGYMYQAIPFKQLAEKIKPHFKRDSRGRKRYFSLEGCLALMFLKSYLGLSDKKLIERINCDWHLQYFCGVQIPRHAPIKDKDIVGRIRLQLSEALKITELEDILADHWKPYMKNTQILMDDATCFESAIKFPTDVNLLYDCSCYIFIQLYELCSKLGLPKPRTKFREQHARQLSYSKLKRKPKKRTIKRTRQLLYWLGKGLDLLDILIESNMNAFSYLTPKMLETIKAIKIVRSQQGLKFNNHDYKIKNRIVSIYKTYIRPIVRGKVNKLVEFGAKANISNVDGINFLEHITFDAFHEGVRMQQSVENHIRRFGEIRAYAGDKIYANRANRKFAATKGIITSFVLVGRPSIKNKAKEEIKKSLATARATVLEGSFGNIKNHYNLKKIQARLHRTEILWIFFGIHTANAVNIGKRIKAKNKEKHFKIAA